MGGVQSSEIDEESKYVRDMQVLCYSDKRDGDEMVGMCVLSYQGKTDWTLNNHHCKKGYILIKKTKNISHVGSTKGIVHGKLYKWFFEREPDSSVVETGFAIFKGQWIFRSGVFNESNKDREAFPKESDMIRKSVENFWRTGGHCNCQYRRCCEGCHVHGECVKSMHVSCYSDKHDNDDVVRMCLFSYQGKYDWKLNNRHCKKGYILIKKTINIDHVH